MEEVGLEQGQGLTDRMGILGRASSGCQVEGAGPQSSSHVIFLRSRVCVASGQCRCPAGRGQSVRDGGVREFSCRRDARLGSRRQKRRSPETRTRI